MDIDQLVNEIVKRVQAKIEDRENVCDAPLNTRSKPRILILNDFHKSKCDEFVKSSQLFDYYDMDYALQEEYDCQISSYEAVIAFHLTNEYLGKIANGIFDSGYTRLFGEALLAGKKIFLPKEEIELCTYQKSAPIIYYRRLADNLQLLTEGGVVAESYRVLPDFILNGGSDLKDSKVERKSVHCETFGEVGICKHVITERDIRKVWEESKIQKIVIGSKAILTDLAREYADKQKIMIVRSDDTHSVRGERR